MHCSTIELLDRFDSRELSRWYRYYLIEPWGWRQDNKHFGVLASMLNPKGGAELPRPENWFTDELPEISVQTDDDEDE